MKKPTMEDIRKTMLNFRQYVQSSTIEIVEKNNLLDKIDNITAIICCLHPHQVRYYAGKMPVRELPYYEWEQCKHIYKQHGEERGYEVLADYTTTTSKIQFKQGEKVWLWSRVVFPKQK